MMDKKGQSFGLNSLPSIAVLFVVGAVVLAYGGKITSDVQSDLPQVTHGDNLTRAVAGNGTAALESVGKNLPTLGTIVVAAIIIFVISTAFVFRR